MTNLITTCELSTSSFKSYVHVALSYEEIITIIKKKLNVNSNYNYIYLFI